MTYSDVRFFIQATQFVFPHPITKHRITDFCPYRAFVVIVVYPRCRFACLGLCTPCFCPFRAFDAIVVYPRCRFACLGLCTLCFCPFMAFDAIVVSQGAALFALGYVRFAFAPSGRLLVIDVCIDSVYGGLKAQYSSIAQGKRSGTLGN